MKYVHSVCQTLTYVDIGISAIDIIIVLMPFTSAWLTKVVSVSFTKQGRKLLFKRRIIPLLIYTYLSSTAFAPATLLDVEQIEMNKNISSSSST